MPLKLLYVLVSDPTHFSVLYFPLSLFSFSFPDLLFSRKLKIRGNSENNIEKKKGTKTGK